LVSSDFAGLAALIFVAALLYSMVGHGGASGYLAAMALYGMAPAEMKPTALVLNIIVSAIGTIQFARAGRFVWRTFWPFALTSVPLAFIGGAIVLPDPTYRRIVGVALLLAAVRLFIFAARSGEDSRRRPPIAAALPLGGAIGLLSGMTGVGGGIFLSPLLLLTKWADARTTAGVSAAFILVNSIAGLLGHSKNVQHLPAGLMTFGIAAALGGVIGSTLGSRRLAPPAVRRMLAVVLVVAAVKLVLVKS
jgi:uncharacterized membrane protein YfcA